MKTTLDEFAEFRASVLPEPEDDMYLNPWTWFFAKLRALLLRETTDDSGIKRWTGLTVTTSEGDPIECLDVVLFEYDFGDEKVLHVDVIGIDSLLYDKLFPGYGAAYEASFRDQLGD